MPWAHAITGLRLAGRGVVEQPARRQPYAPTVGSGGVIVTEANPPRAWVSTSTISPAISCPNSARGSEVLVSVRSDLDIGSARGAALNLDLGLSGPASGFGDVFEGRSPGA